MQCAECGTWGGTLQKVTYRDGIIQKVYLCEYCRHSYEEDGIASDISSAATDGE